MPTLQFTFLYQYKTPMPQFQTENYVDWTYCPKTSCKNSSFLISPSVKVKSFNKLILYVHNNSF